MTKTRKLTARFGDLVFTRTTHRTYTHVIIARNLTPKHEGQLADGRWQALHWCGSLALAQEQKRKTLGFWNEVEIIPVEA